MRLAVEVGVLDELIEVLDGPFLVRGDQTDVGAFAFLWNHPHVTMRGILRLDVEIEVAVVGHVVEFVLEASNDLHFSRHPEDFGGGSVHTRGVDDATATKRKCIPPTFDKPIGKLIFAVVLSLHFGDAMPEMNVRTAPFGLFHDPSFKQVLFEHVTRFGQELCRAVREDDADAVHGQSDDVLRQVEFELLGREMRQAFATMNGGTDLRVSLQHHHGQAEPGSVQRCGAAARTCADDHEVHVDGGALSHGMT